MSSEERGQSTTNGDSAPQEAFALVGNEIRAEILRVLGEDPHSVHSFSELHSNVAVDSDSGQFNYHLRQLVGHFVDRCDNGYQLRPEGITLYRTIVAGTFTRRASLAPFDAGFGCYFCGTAVEATYDDGKFVVQCPDCDHVYLHDMAPPSLADDEQALLSRVDQYSRHDTLAVARGVCPICVGGIERQFISAAEGPFHSGEDLDVFVYLSCNHCGAGHYLSVGTALLKDPGLISFCYERGLDVTTTPVWELEFASTDRYTTVRSTAPWEVALELTLDDDTLELVVDENLNVIERNYS